MNIKLHTPKSLKMGSGMSTLKQFLLSIVATTISIALTFGTAAVIDAQKSKAQKRQIVMMLMYDMNNSLKVVEEADSLFKWMINVQTEIARDTTKFDSMRFVLPQAMPIKDKITETTEQIFSSSIETINTVGNPLFTEKVAEFYQMRRQFKTVVCDSIWKELERTPTAESVKNTLDFGIVYYALTTSSFRVNMQSLFTQCKEMMEITDEELNVYQAEKELLDRDEEEWQRLIEENNNAIIKAYTELEEAKTNLHLE